MSLVQDEPVFEASAGCFCCSAAGLCCSAAGFCCSAAGFLLDPVKPPNMPPFFCAGSGAFSCGFFSGGRVGLCCGAFASASIEWSCPVRNEEKSKPASSAFSYICCNSCLLLSTPRSEIMNVRRSLSAAAITASNNDSLMIAASRAHFDVYL
eukprot:Pompholyxophrys_punicea_v1_NODE_17_length_5980_cov_2.985654.p10 type:complete len:152 gc:universal NODE_17_length_5980_cov_2.985654:4928-5383(+)